MMIKKGHVRFKMLGCSFAIDTIGQTVHVVFRNKIKTLKLICLLQ